MFEFTRVTDRSGYLIRTATDKTAPVGITIQLENGISAEEFIEELEDMENPDYKMIAVDSEDICSILTQEDEAHFGRVFFSKTGKCYCTVDDLNWLKELKPRKICLSIAGNVMLNHAVDIVKLFETMLPDTEYLLFSFEWQDLCIIKVNVLAV